MIEELVRISRRGGIIVHHLVLECLHGLDPDHPEIVLSPLPGEVWGPLVAFIKEYQQGPLVTTLRILPASDQVEAAKRWIESQQDRSPGLSLFDGVPGKTETTA
jgi:hypothetical protein